MRGMAAAVIWFPQAPSAHRLRGLHRLEHLTRNGEHVYPPAMIPEPTSTKVAAHYTWGDTCDGWHLVRAAGLSVIEERMPPGTKEQRHWHARALQVFYVLAGTLTLEIEGVRHQLGPRSGIELPQGTAHQASNETTETVEFLVISTPPAQGDRHYAEN